MSGWIGAWGNAATVTNLTVTGSEIISVNTSTDALRITQTGTGNALKVEDSANPDSSPFVIDAEGRVGIGGTASNASVYNNKLITGAVNSYANRLVATGDSTVTNTMYGYSSALSTSAAAYTLSASTHFAVFGTSVGAGSTITNQYGFFVDSSLTGATNNYGFYSNVASGSGRYNFYASGAAANYFAGDLTIYGNTAVPAGGTTGVGYKFSSTTNLGVFFGSGAPTLSAGKGSLYLRTDGTGPNDRIYVNANGGTNWTAVVTVA